MSNVSLTTGDERKGRVVSTKRRASTSCPPSAEGGRDGYDKKSSWSMAQRALIDFNSGKNSPTNGRCGSWFWTAANATGLVVTLIVQGSILNFFLINYNEDAQAHWYFLFFADFVILVTLMFSLTFAWRYYHRKRRSGLRIGSAVSGSRHGGEHSEELGQEHIDTSTAVGPDTPRVGHGIFKFSFPKPMGLLPLIYICWVVYSSNMLIKLSLLYSTSTPDKMVLAGVKDSKEYILICLSASVAVFLFWVESHWTLGDRRQQRLSKPTVDDLVCHTALEFFDSLTFLDLVTPDDTKELERDRRMISSTMKSVVVGLACVNFVLPTLGLYRLSRTHFGEKANGMIRVIDEHTGKPTTRGLGISILYHALRLIAVNIPYLVIRIIISQDPEKELSVFVVKNALGIWISLRNLIPEVKQWLRVRKAKQQARMRGSELRVRIDPAAGTFDPSKGGWELPVIWNDGDRQKQHEHPNLGKYASVDSTTSTDNTHIDNDNNTTTTSPDMESKSVDFKESNERKF